MCHDFIWGHRRLSIRTGTWMCQEPQRQWKISILTSQDRIVCLLFGQWLFGHFCFSTCVDVFPLCLLSLDSCIVRRSHLEARNTCTWVHSSLCIFFFSRRMEKPGGSGWDPGGCFGWMWRLSRGQTEETGRWGSRGMKSLEVWGET